jgi:hypothetical protein
MEKSLARQNASEANASLLQIGSRDATNSSSASTAVGALGPNGLPGAAAASASSPEAMGSTPPPAPQSESSESAAATANDASSATDGAASESATASSSCPAAASFPGTGWRGMVEVYDLRGLGLAQLHVKGLRMVSRVLGLGQAHYPENLRTAFFINTPAVFKAIWSTIKLVLDKNTVDKIQMTRHNNEAVLKQNLLNGTFEVVQTWHPPELL